MGKLLIRQNINLSLYLMLLDEKMIEYVILHELTHTVELNHSTKFWEKLSVFCGEDAKMLDKNCDTIYPTVTHIFRALKTITNL